ncbi:HAD family hydrolase [Lachnospiraceae bacterium KGMB03038]|nr:HAD family hydrolase [Lachnospiraceae bacterium KGMB03038]
MAYDVFLFDLDGTLTDSSVGITKSVIYALKKYGIEEEDQKKLYAFIGPPLTESFQKFYGFSAEQSIEAVEYYREYYREIGIFENKVYEGMKETLRQLKEKGKRLMVATSKPEPFARRIIRHFGLASYFEYVAGMELDGGRGTKAEVIAYALQSCGIDDRGKTVMVGDREHDVIGAKKEGLDCIGVLYGFGSREELEKAGADWIIEKPEELCELA